jgi:hypothetical protein
VPLRQLIEEGLRARLAVHAKTPRVSEYTHQITREKRWERALSVTSKYGSGAGDIARDHDRYLIEDLSR